MAADRQPQRFVFDKKNLADIIKRADEIYGSRKGLSVVLTGGDRAERARFLKALAKQQNVALQRVDFSALTAEGPGQASRGLAALWAAAEPKKEILFFDEADALFGRRSSVKDSHDKYAKLESIFVRAVDGYHGIVAVATASPLGSFAGLEKFGDLHILFEPALPQLPIDTLFTRPQTNLHFQVLVGDLEIGFCHVSGMTSTHTTAGLVDDTHGDWPHERVPGVLTYENLILRRAVTLSKDLFWWRQKVIGGKADKRRVDLYQLTAAGAKPINQWTFHECWPCRWSGPSFDSMAGDIAYEEVELCYERFEWV